MNAQLFSFYEYLATVFAILIIISVIGFLYESYKDVSKKLKGK